MIDVSEFIGQSAARDFVVSLKNPITGDSQGSVALVVSSGDALGQQHPARGGSRAGTRVPSRAGATSRSSVHSPLPRPRAGSAASHGSGSALSHSFVRRMASAELGGGDLEDSYADDAFDSDVDGEENL